MRAQGSSPAGVCGVLSGIGGARDGRVADAAPDPTPDPACRAFLLLAPGPAVDIPPPERVSLDVKMQRLNIEWADGHASVFPLDGLREACPCAECEGKKVERIPKPGFLHIFRQTNRWKDVRIEKAGSVGLRITWDDGHRGGIYRWDRLRELQPAA